MSIVSIVNRLGQEVCLQFQLFQQAEQICLVSHDKKEIFAAQKELARIADQFDYLNNWIENYHKSNYLVKLKRT